jgi:hypothetical protein
MRAEEAAKKSPNHEIHYTPCAYSQENRCCLFERVLWSNEEGQWNKNGLFTMRIIYFQTRVEYHCMWNIFENIERHGH